MPSSKEHGFSEHFIGFVLGIFFMGFCVLAYTQLYKPMQGNPTAKKLAPAVVSLDEQIKIPLVQTVKSTPNALSEASTKAVAYVGTPTGLGTSRINVQRQMAELAYKAHESKLQTPYNLGSYGCAAAIWEYVAKPALKQAYPEAVAKIPYALTHTQSFLDFYKKQKLGRLTVVPAPDLSPEKTPPGTVLIGIKKGTGDHHMLVAVDVDWGTVKNPSTGASVRVAKDGLTDAYAGNTGLPQFGKPHFRIQEFAEHLGFLNQHHGAINSDSENNYYDRFYVMTFAP
ncbi:MAG: hypothetical protein ACK5T0_04735 [Vampirovibrionales bacterium]